MIRVAVAVGLLSVAQCASTPARAAVSFSACRVSSEQVEVSVVVGDTNGEQMFVSVEGNAPMLMNPGAGATFTANVAGRKARVSVGGDGTLPDLRDVRVRGWC